MPASEAAPPSLLMLVTAIVAGDLAAAAAMLDAAPALARARAATGATRADAAAHFLAPIQHYLYEDDTALHIAAAAHREAVAALLIATGADVRARNRRGAEPLHYAADGAPGSPGWNPEGQAATITCLIAAGADPNAVDRSGVAPLHRAVRTRSSGAVRALLAGGADPRAANRSGSTPLRLAQRTTGRSGSGSAAARTEQQEILRLLKARGEQ